MLRIVVSGSGALPAVLACSMACLTAQAVPSDARTGQVTGAAGRDVSAETVRGPARVIDGDTLDVGGRRIRLEGIDAPEIRQVCRKRAHATGDWPAGREAARTLARWVHRQEVVCQRTGLDRYGRMLGRCHAGGRELNAAMIRHGLAWAFRKYSQSYVLDERTARAAQRGVWAAACEPAWAYRANRWRHGAGSKAPAGCPIKGNVSRRGRIYHMPWDRWYHRTRIDLAKGERWFCDERQARAAGWRSANARGRASD